MPKHATIVAVNKHLHPVRLATYTARCGNDPFRALELYKWNLQLSASFQQVLAITEVALRNAIDGQLRTWNASQAHHTMAGAAHSQDWLIDPARPLNSLTRSSRRTAEKHANEAKDIRDSGHPRKSAAVTHDDLLAQITFGVWTKLLPTQDTKDPNYHGRQILWRQALHHAFPHRPPTIQPESSSLIGPVGYMGSGTGSRIWSPSSMST
ncbi:hypothetical protein [Nocardia flavorosea]|uniref:hypothetical protein n=1 Tax=Nocardia flavorosea TaxID=53429 RepID=UPI000B2B360F|nr:hypothetical protein [Nocardia flavorosea]